MPLTKGAQYILVTYNPKLYTTICVNYFDSLKSVWSVCGVLFKFESAISIQLRISEYSLFVSAENNFTDSNNEYPVHKVMEQVCNGNRNFNFI